MKKKAVIPAAVFAILASTIGVTTIASAHGVMGGKGGPSAEVRQAVDSNDYNAFVKAAAGTPLADKITQDNFDEFVQASTLMEEGKREEAKTILDQLGLRPPHGPRMDDATRAKVDAALEAGDYNAWKAAVGDSPIASKVTADNFAKFAEAHKLHEAGKDDQAKAIMDELGITPPELPHHGEPDHHNNDQ